MIVADANLLAQLMIPHARNILADAVFQKDAEWAMPGIGPAEFRNIALSYVRFKKLPVATAKEILQQANRVIGSRIYPVNGDEVFDLAMKITLTAYDAEYAWLARRLGAPLVTEDRDLLINASDVARTAADFVESR